MLINGDLAAPAVSFADEALWLPLPGAGIDVRVLEHAGDDGGRTTSVVRYQPSTRLPFCEHPLGEEVLVLEGAFADEAGEYPAGTYVRNPPGSGNAPWSDGGCVLFVKRGQFHPADRERIAIDLRGAEWFPGLSRGIAVLPLHGFGSERVTLVRWAPETCFVPHQHPAGEEIYVLDGAVEDEEGRYTAGSWLRSPPGSQHRPFSLEGCLLYVKIGHLPAVVA